MSTVKSLDDLKRIREEALKKQQLKETSGKTEIIVGMGTVGIAAGARETLKAIMDMIEAENLSDIIVRQTGNIGLDSFEPIVQVVLSR
jgi:NADP-reducing hydrogenase subunit HndB